MSALLTTFGVDWHLLLTHVLNFGILAVALSWLLYKPVMKMVNEREALITKGVDDAEAATERLKSAGGEAIALLQGAEKKAEEIVKEARLEAGSEKSKIIGEAEARAAAVAADAEARAKEEMHKAKRESEKEIARLAILAAEKVLAQKV